MKRLKSAVTLAGAIAVSALGSTALANHERWENWPPPESASQRYVVPQQPAIVGYVASPPAYYYDHAPRYYSEPATAYYYESRPVVAYYYGYDDSAFPQTESRD